MNDKKKKAKLMQLRLMDRSAFNYLGGVDENVTGNIFRKYKEKLLINN